MTQAPERTHRTPRWIKVVLVLSLALNLLIAGLVLGALVSGKGGERPRSERDMAGLPFLRALEPADRRAVLADLRRDAGSFRENRRETRARFASLLEALRAETFDREAVKVLLDEQRGIAVARQNTGERIILDRVVSMSVAERRAYADRLEQSLKRRRSPRQ